jgi:hypothetical protein
MQNDNFSSFLILYVCIFASLPLSEWGSYRFSSQITFPFADSVTKYLVKSDSWT